MGKPEQLPGGQEPQPKGFLDVARQKGAAALGALKQQVEEYKEKPHGTYTFERSKYNDISTKSDFERSYKYLALQNGAEKIDVFLRGVADNTKFLLDPKSKRPRVNLDRGADFERDYLHALTILKANGALLELGRLDFNKDGLKAVHKLPLEQQHKVMNHAIAYLRAEKLQRDLQGACKMPPINFVINAEWARDPRTRKATVMDVIVTKTEDLSTEELLEKGKSTVQIEREKGQSKLPPELQPSPYERLSPEDRRKVDESVAWFKRTFPGKKPEVSKPEPKSPYEQLSPADRKKVDEFIAWFKRTFPNLFPGAEKTAPSAKPEIPPLLRRNPPEPKYKGGTYWGKPEYPVKSEPKSPYEQLSPADRKKVDESVAWFKFVFRHKAAQEGIWDRDVQAKAKPTVVPAKPAKIEIPPLSPKPKYEGGIYYGGPYNETPSPLKDGKPEPALSQRMQEKLREARESKAPPLVMPADVLPTSVAPEHANEGVPKHVPQPNEGLDVTLPPSSNLPKSQADEPDELPE